MESIVYNLEGQESGKITLDDKLFGLNWNADLVHQTVVSMQANARQSIAHAKDRSEVRGGGKKPWRQKGTGRARHGSSRSPIWVGGGVTHGPLKERSYDKQINKKAKTKALFTVLSQKLRDNELIFVDDVKLTKPETKTARVLLEALSKVGFEKIAYKKGNRAYVATEALDANVIRSFDNITSSKVEEIRNLNPLDVLNYKYLVIVNPKESLEILTGRVK